MTTRRAFLQAALLAGALPGSVRADQFRGEVLLVWDGACAAAGHNPALRRRDCVLAASAVREDLPACDALLADGRWRAVVGLTRDAERFLLTQCAAGHGYRLTYTGTHEPAPAGITHTLKGESRLIGALADELARAGTRWPDALAAARGRLADTPAGKHRVSRTAGLKPGPATVPWLTSWALLRA